MHASRCGHLILGARWHAEESLDYHHIASLSTIPPCQLGLFGVDELSAKPLPVLAVISAILQMISVRSGARLEHSRCQLLWLFESVARMCLTCLPIVTR